MEGYEMPEWMDLDRMIYTQNRMKEQTMFGDGEEFPPESPDEFSHAPLTFKEMAAALREDLEEVFQLTETLNRFSPEYLKVSRILEGAIRHVGSCCVTKAVLEQNAIELPRLEDLQLGDLYDMVSFNFRKTRQAFLDSKRLRNCADMDLYQMESRWAGLTRQIEATEIRIRQIREGKIDTAKLLERTNIFKPESGRERRKELKERRALAAKGRSLPVIGSVARRMIAERKAEEREQREEERLQRQAMGLLPGSARPFTAEVFRPSKEMLDLIRMDEEQEKLKLYHDARPSLYEAPPRDGPPEATRKKLREKRKKKK